MLVDVAVAAWFASDFVHDLVVCEEDMRRVPESHRSVAPKLFAGDVPHGRCTKQENACIVRPLDLRGAGAILRRVRSIVNVVIVCHESGSFHPVPCLDGPVRVRRVSSIHGKPSPQIEESTIGNGVFVVVSIVEGENLPPQSTITSLGIPPQGLRVERRLSESQPLRFPLWRVRKVYFGG